MDVRAATSAEIAAIQAIDVSLDHAGTDARILQEAIGGGRVVVALSGGGVAGYVRWEWLWDRIPYCFFVRVHPSHQGAGAGRALYALVEADLRGRGCDFWLSSTEEDNKRSLKFHRALGFRLIGALTELGQESREVFMRKDLG